MSLKAYNQKRRFEKTAEPRGRTLREATRHRFVIQKHAASRLHYDFRLELGGTLKSWAVPKGMPYARGEKRLAIQVEDHPVSYIDFEGTIPKGQYGGGTVMVWDRGTFEPSSASPLKDLGSGKLHFNLKGKKLQGEWYLVRLRDDNQWLLVRGKDGMRPVSRKADDTSAISGRTMKEITGGAGLKELNGVVRHAPAPTTKRRKKPLTAPSFVEPMKARLVRAAPVGDWVYEVKLDGFRALALIQNGEARLLSRNEKDLGSRFPEVRDSLEQIPVRDATIDGEIVALDSKGRSSFQLLQARAEGEQPPIFFYAFDLLYVDGMDLRDSPLTTRKRLLERLLKEAPGNIRYSASLDGPATKLLKAAEKLGLEGLIGKRKDSAYEPGQRTGAWVKLKLQQEQEMVIGGYTQPEGSRSHFGALLIGCHVGNSLQFAGKVGAGFNEKLLKELHNRFKKIRAHGLPVRKSSREDGRAFPQPADSRRNEAMPLDQA